MGGWVVAAILGLFLIGSCLPSSDRAASTASGTTKWVSARSLNCRSDNSPDARVVGHYRQNQSVTVTEERAGWARTDGPDNCWVAGQYLANAPAGPDEGGGAQSLLAVPVDSSSSQRSGASAGGYGGRLHVSSGSGNTRSKVSSSVRKKASTRKKKGSSKRRKQRSGASYSGSYCPCSGSSVCIGPRGGRYCITSGGNKRYGV